MNLFLAATLAAIIAGPAKAQWNPPPSSSTVHVNHAVLAPSAAVNEQRGPNEQTEEFSAGHPAVVGVGAGIGYPTGINLSVALLSKYGALRVSGGSWGTSWNGVQGDLIVNVTHSTSTSIGVAILGGRFSTSPILADDSQHHTLKQNYLGIAYDMYLSGFFLQTGVLMGTGDFPSPQMVYQCGYMIEVF